jgi:uncharacterized protein YndB with AHSA1/START domain
MSNQTTTVIEPVVREVTVKAPADACFRVFVEGFATWWPPEHHIGDDRTITDFVIEGRVGGRTYDVDTNGVECQWGTVLEYDPPRRLVIAWHIQSDWTIDLDPARQSEVEITFTPVDADTTQVKLSHGKLERHADGAAMRTGISGDGGWTILVARFADRAEGREPRPLPQPA